MPRPFNRNKMNHTLLENGFKKPVLRVPHVNTLPNALVKRREIERRGRFSKKLALELKKKDERSGLRLSNGCGYLSDRCYQCNSPAQEYFTITPECEIVCKFCAVVQHEKYFEEQMESSQKLSSSYQKGTYLSERLRTFGNLEPRISREDLKLIGQVYSVLDALFCKICDEEKDQERKTKALRDSGLEGWFIDHPGNITKKFVNKLLKCVDKVRRIYPTLRRSEGIESEDSISFALKYTERWLQIKIHICGKKYYETFVSPIPSMELLNSLYLLARTFANVYVSHKVEANIHSEKKSIINTDLLFLILLYNINPDLVETFGWYFLNEPLTTIEFMPKDAALFTDYNVACKIIEYLNSSGSYKNTLELREILFLRNKWHIAPLKKLIELAEWQQ